MSCEQSHLDGSYVLGALSAAERQEFERHLQGCQECSASVGQLAGLPGLLARVDEDVLTALAPEPAAPDTLLPALVREVRRTQRRRTGFTAMAAAAATVVVVLGSLSLAANLGDDTGPTEPRAGSSAPPTGPPTGGPGGKGAAPDSALAMEPVGVAPMTASIAFESVDWGIRLSLTCRYPSVDGSYAEPRAATYSLHVRTRDGRDEQVATWWALPGRTMQLEAATAAAWDDIVSVEVLTADGKPVLELTT